MSTNFHKHFPCTGKYKYYTFFFAIINMVDIKYMAYNLVKCS